jgi:hypothetical protein
MRPIILLLVSAIALGACAKRSERVYFNGNYYPAKVGHVGADRKAFVVTVRGAGQGLDGAREAGRYEGTRYCIDDYGTSDIEWSQGPDAPAGQLRIENGDLILRGRCIIW